MDLFEITPEKPYTDKELNSKDPLARCNKEKMGKLYPDAERATDQVIEIDGIRILTKDECPELTWIGTIDYKEKGLHKGFSWR